MYLFSPNNVQIECVYMNFSLFFRCGCGHCVILPSFERADCICCQEIDEVAAEADRNNVRCITSAQDFDAAILNPVTLYIAWQHFTEKWRQQAKSFGARNNE